MPSYVKITAAVQFQPLKTGWFYGAANIAIPTEESYRALRRSCQIIIDDGSPTELERKGDGVQSLAALSLMRHSSVAGSMGRELILAIEEPESHLHPKAIHRLRSVIFEIAKTHQVIMTTHCPVFVDRLLIGSNILVQKNKARPAKSVEQIREMLGVRASDNLQHAEVVLLVEGEDDRISLMALLTRNSQILAQSIREGTLGVDTLLGGSKLSYKLSLLRDAICLSHVFLDHDDCGKTAAARAKEDELLSQADITFASCQGMEESELEDLLNTDVYKDVLLNEFNVSLDCPTFKCSEKWSLRIKNTFIRQGQTWSEAVETQVKSRIAGIIAATSDEVLNPHKRGPIDALVGALERKLTNQKIIERNVRKSKRRR